MRAVSAGLGARKLLFIVVGSKEGYRRKPLQDGFTSPVHAVVTRQTRAIVMPSYSKLRCFPRTVHKRWLFPWLQRGPPSYRSHQGVGKQAGDP
ncbi:hypothetical protein Y1Q_0022091 [Alligator mississippiensis]|uniref:Uncharacterized protein n=1 Tax=Alligator mississippiensis TaxID=8496 RepID=A0A151PDH6_ALLMI|nr:hypothetical protein Y1Q_0022091 [Alligator mississippiensis]